jgi:hypothetical protein
VRKKIRRKILIFFVLSLRGGLNQGANVGEQRESFLIVEEALEFDQVRMETEIRLTRNLQRQERSLGDCKIRANGLIGWIGGTKRNKQIVRVISTEEKDANERFVIGASLRECADKAEFAETANDGSRGGRTAGEP